MTDEHHHKNLIDLSEARKRQRPIRGASAQKWGSSNHAKKKKPANSRARDAFNNLLRWIQFLAFLALTSYILQQCGML